MKKTAIIYADWLDMVEMMTDEDAAWLFRAILSNMNEKAVEPVTYTQKIVWSQISNSLETNAKKWEEVSAKRREASNKRWHPEEDLSMQMDTNEYKCMQMDTNEYKSIQKDYVTDTGTGTDTESVTVTGTDTGGGNNSTTAPPPTAYGIQCKKSVYVITPEQVKKWKSQYTNIDVDYQLKAITKWAGSKAPNSRPPASSIEKTITAWLAEENGKAKSAPRRGFNNAPQRDYDFDEIMRKARAKRGTG